VSCFVLRVTHLDESVAVGQNRFDLIHGALPQLLLLAASALLACFPAAVLGEVHPQRFAAGRGIFALRPLALLREVGSKERERGEGVRAALARERQEIVRECLLHRVFAAAQLLVDQHRALRLVPVEAAAQGVVRIEPVGW